MTEMRSIRVDYETWKAFGDICDAGGSNRAAEIKRFILKTIEAGELPDDDLKVAPSSKGSLEERIQKAVQIELQKALGAIAPKDESEPEVVTEPEVEPEVDPDNKTLEQLAAHLAKGDKSKTKKILRSLKTYRSRQQREEPLCYQIYTKNYTKGMEIWDYDATTERCYRLQGEGSST